MPARRRAGLTAEALDPAWNVRSPDEELQRDGLLELQVRRSHDEPHAALTQQTVDAVLPEDDVPDARDGGPHGTCGRSARFLYAHVALKFRRQAATVDGRGSAHHDAARA